MDHKQYNLELKSHIEEILNSQASKKLIVAGPGTGKTFFFKEIINHTGGAKNEYLTLTFINNLEDELQRDLGESAKVYTFHGYCHYLIRKYSNLRNGLRDNFEYYPTLIKLIKSDWEIINEGESPKFSDLMRKGTIDSSTEFFLERSNYYNAVGYDDSVFRVYKSFVERKEVFDKYKLIIVDEFQDFNNLETSVLLRLSDYSPILIVGDDDQALYCLLRNSDPKYIRDLFDGKDFEKFELPFCLRCPSSVIFTFKNIVQSAINSGFLEKRIKKRFDFFPPKKETDSKTYPKLKLVISSVQRASPLGANYFGRYISQEIKKIPQHEIKESFDNNFPTILIIGPKYYLKSIIPFLEKENLQIDFKDEKVDFNVIKEDAMKILKKDEKSNLGWRIYLEATKPEFYSKVINSLNGKSTDLFDLLEDLYRDEVLNKVKAYEQEKNKEDKTEEIDTNKPSIKLVTYEGSKGLSAQHVFITGFQNGDIPKNPLAIQDIEICKFLVAITRTRKQCQILCTSNFAGKSVDISEFVKWLPKTETEIIKVNKDYWK